MLNMSHPLARSSDLLTHLQHEVSRTLGDRTINAVVVLGSGLSSTVRDFHIEKKWDLPRPDNRPAIKGHPGMLALGRWAGRQVVVFLGRCHGYEGHDWTRIALPSLLAHRLDAQLLVLTNMAGTINTQLGTRQLMAINGHLNATGHSWFIEEVRGQVVGEPRQVLGAISDVNRAPYHREATQCLADILAGRPVPGSAGVYAGVMGPNYETPAEVRAFSQAGADVVGMSTVAEAEVAHQLQIPVVGMSCLSNWAAGADPLANGSATVGSENPTAGSINHEEVIDAGRAVADEFQTVLTAFFRRFPFH